MGVLSKRSADTSGMTMLVSGSGWFVQKDDLPAGVVQVQRNGDGSLSVFLENGQTLAIGADQFVVQADGMIVLSDDALELIAAADGGGLSDSLVGLLLLLGGGAAALGLGGAQGGEDTQPEGPDAVIGGVSTGAVTEDQAAQLTTTGQLSVTDADAGQAVFVAQAATAGTNGLGTFTLAADGTWTYAADNSQAAIQGLKAGQTTTDSFTAVTADGTEQLVTVRITGVNEPVKPVESPDAVMGRRAERNGIPS